jgi:prophage regulatory protein
VNFLSTTTEPTPTIIRGWDAVCRAVGRSRVQLWRDVREGRFPEPIQLGANSVGWHRAEVEEWLATRPRRTYGSASGEAA